MHRRNGKEMALARVEEYDLNGSKLDMVLVMV